MGATVKVWDPYVRMFHWGLAGTFVVAWLTADELRDMHEFAGYAAGALVASRLLMGLVGSRYARFRQFVRSPGMVVAYAAAMVRKREPRYIGHNPLGGIMVIVLIAMMAALSLTGWMQTTDTYWGVEWVENLHETLANVLLGCVALHLCGVAYESVRHRENLVAAMVSGSKRKPDVGDVA
ncbi:cytochrome b/b6 domain-containing protein [Sinorhizobium sp. BG8]|uniref:cytochrome b/b6 domain-containing protein n=1 Tax=Sinorhizobium sp. BG8 TaxID=2613773 RepID=UPI00193D1B2E|nr:cytochrome b/b6 domain-containing protein [Sinorhizobium sp. BG8]QRM56551.1 cytochrome B [Sinorhizobium sp. BG8]